MTTSRSKVANTGNFQKLSGEARYRLIVRSWGLDKTGKNHFGYTGPGPIYCQYFDPGGAEGVAEKFISGEFGEPKEINAIYYKFDKTQMDQASAIVLRDQFIDDYEYALTQARTIQWDETEIWALFRWAEFGSNSDAPKTYDRLNTAYRLLLQEAYDAGVNLQLIQKVKEKWGTGSNGKGLAPTGIFEPQGFQQANYIVQINLEHSWDLDDDGKGVFTVRVDNCRQNATLNKQSFAGLDWPTLGMLVFPNSGSEDWS